jgi:hypothetical protein
MKWDTNYGGVRWSKHALERLKERELTQGEVFEAFQHPTTSRWAKSNRGIKYIRIAGEKKIEVIAKKDRGSGEWVIMSCWSGRVKRNWKSTGEAKGKQGWWVRGWQWLRERAGVR